MGVETTADLLKHELGDLLYAERQILKSLPKMIREASNPGMKERLEAHRTETEQQIGNLEQVFEQLGYAARGKKCPGILGILEEKKEFDEEEDAPPEMVEAFNLGAGLRVEHYEIAGYRSAIALAEATGKKEIAGLLRQNLDQEVAMARFIETNSTAVLQAMSAKSAK